MLSAGDLARLANVTPGTLRQLDEMGLLRPPARDHETSGEYTPRQLARLHRLLALPELGLNPKDIRALLGEDISVAELRGMLRLRRVQIDRTVVEERERLARAERHLRALERGVTAPAGPTIVVRRIAALRIAAATGDAVGYGHRLGSEIGRLLARVLDHLTRVGARPGLGVAWFTEPRDDGLVQANAGYEIAGQRVPPDEAVRVVDLPGADVACVVHRGPMDTVEPAYAALLAWIEDRGYRRAGPGREFYLQWHDGDPAGNITELQVPIVRVDPRPEPQRHWASPGRGEAHVVPEHRNGHAAPPERRPDDGAWPAYHEDDSRHIRLYR